jgi:hypothetical protein
MNNGRFVWSGDTGRKIQNHTVQRSGLRMLDKMDVLKWQLQKNSRQSIIPPISTCIFRINILLHYCYIQFHYIFGLPLFRLDKNISQRCDCLTGKSVYINNNKELPLTSLKTKTHATKNTSGYGWYYTLPWIFLQLSLEDVHLIQHAQSRSLHRVILNFSAGVSWSDETTVVHGL